MPVSEEKRSFCERSDMNGRKTHMFVADTYLENRIQNKYPIDHELGSRTGFWMQTGRTCTQRDADERRGADIQRISASEENLFSECRMRKTAND